MGLNLSKNLVKKEKKAPNKKVQWTKFGVVTVLYLLFLFWVGSWWGLIVVPFIYDVYISKKIKWQWWKDADSGVTRFVMSWVDALVFALIAVYFINLFFFQNFVIPSSSLEKSLLTGDYLCVSKLSYGPRIPNTPLTLPLTQHTLPVFGCKSYIEWPQWEYRRVKGLGNVELNDIVVFNYPAGDSILTDESCQTQFYEYCYKYGALSYISKHYGITATDENIIYDPALYQEFMDLTKMDSLSYDKQLDIFNEVYSLGRQYLVSNFQKYGNIGWRPVDRRENYVKRCVGLPGMTLQIKDRIVYLDGKPNKEPDNVQYTYKVVFQNGKRLPQSLIDELGITQEDINQLNQMGVMPMTKHVVDVLSQHKELIHSITINNSLPDFLYPLNGCYGWTRDNYGPVWIPKKGSQVPGGLNLKNIAIYERPIRVYEGNDLQIKGGKIYINGKEATNYTFKMDYYWMMGDNRHNSADSRYWGFVPEDHIVGKPLFIWWSSDPDRGGFAGIRWHRLFNWVDNIK